MIFVSGSSGFIGTHLVKQLKDAVCIPHSQLQSIKLKPFDQFYFLSTYGNLASQTDEDEMFKANLEDLIDILKQAKDIKFKSFVFMSTSSVTLRQQTTYSRFKKAAEEILLAVMERHNLPICIIRPFSVCGVGEQPEHLIPTLIRSTVDHSLVNFVPDPVHDFIAVEDVVAGIITLSQKQARGIFQLGTGIKTTNQQVLDLIEEIAGKKANINKINSLRDYDNLDWVSTNFRARGFGWLPIKTLDITIKEMVESYMSTGRV